MTLRVYRISPNGDRTELSRSCIERDTPYRDRTAAANPDLGCAGAGCCPRADEAPDRSAAEGTPE